MKIEVKEVKNLDNDLTVVFKEFYELGRQAAKKVYGR